MENGKGVLVRRDNREKQPVAIEEIPTTVAALLEEIQGSLYERAKRFRDENTVTPESYEKFLEFFNEEGGGFAVVPWDGEPESEAKVKEDTRATIRVLPFGNETEAQGKKCLISGKPAKHMAIFSKAY
jgi:prolyl-tRNA synthetase